VLSGDRHRLGIGWVTHHRYDQAEHRFRYPLFMPLLDLDDLPGAFSRSRLWSVEKPNMASFYRSDHYGAPELTMAEQVRATVATDLGIHTSGRVLMLAHLRYCGHVFNPITLFFCLDQDNQPVACVAEVANTPWGEHVCYSFALDPKARTWRHENDKRMHVSPFLPMDMQYRWQISLNEHDHEQRLVVHIANHKDGERQFNAALTLKLEALTTATMRRVLFKYPLQTLQVVFGIYWQALRLKFKGVRYVEHAPIVPSSDANKSLQQ